MNDNPNRAPKSERTDVHSASNRSARPTLTVVHAIAVIVILIVACWQLFGFFFYAKPLYSRLPPTWEELDERELAQVDYCDISIVWLPAIVHLSGFALSIGTWIYLARRNNATFSERWALALVFVSLGGIILTFRLLIRFIGYGD